MEVTEGPSSLLVERLFGGGGKKVCFKTERKGNREELEMISYDFKDIRMNALQASI